MASIEERVENLIQKPIEDLGYSLYDVQYVKEGNTMFLRVVIEKDGLIDVEDCVTVSHLINPLLDEKDLIDEHYILDVCSKEEGWEENE